MRAMRAMRAMRGAHQGDGTEGKGGGGKKEGGGEEGNLLREVSKALQEVLADLKKLKFVCSPSSSADGIMQSDYRWLAQPSGKITQKNLP